MSIASASGLNYQLPQGGITGKGFIQPQAPVEPVEPAQGQTSLPPPNEDLAQVQGLTDKYYDTYGKLKSYVEGMNAQGIDVTKPDYGDPAAMEAFKLYKMLEANVMTTANQLKQQQKMITTLRPLEAQGKYRFAEGVNPNEQLITGMQPNQIGYSTDLEPGVEQAMKTLSENPLTLQDRTNQIEYFNKTKQELETRRDLAKNPAEKEYMQHQINQLTKAYQATKLFAPPNPYSAASLGFKAKVEGAGELLKQSTRVLRGVGYDGQTVVNGRAANTSDQIAGLYLSPIPTIGKKTKKSGMLKRRVLYTYQLADGRIFAKFAPTELVDNNGQPIEEGQISVPDEELSNREPSEFIKELGNNNKDYVGKYSDFLNVAQAGGYVDKGVANEPVLMKGMTKTELPLELERKIEGIKSKIKAVGKKGSGPVTLQVGGSTLKIVPQQETNWLGRVKENGKRTYTIYLNNEVLADDVENTDDIIAGFEEKGYFNILAGIKPQVMSQMTTDQPKQTTVTRPDFIPEAEWNAMPPEDQELFK